MRYNQSIFIPEHAPIIKVAMVKTFTSIFKAYLVYDVLTQILLFEHRLSYWLPSSQLLQYAHTIISRKIVATK